MAVEHRSLGKLQPDIPPMGVGCWAIGGPTQSADGPLGWGACDDEESIRALQRARELGIVLFDTADIYGCGHSERLLGRAFAGRFDEIFIATKFGHTFDEQRCCKIGQDIRPEYVRPACLASLARLGTERIDLYQLHIDSVTDSEAAAVRDALEDLVAEGLIRAYGHSTDLTAPARVFAAGPHCAAIQQVVSVFRGNQEILALCAQQGLASICRSPLGMGVLTGKYRTDTQMPTDDIRSRWSFDRGWERRQLDLLPEVRDALSSGGRTLAQGALAWIWAHSPQTIPIPGCRTVAQVEENVGALAFGPLEDEPMARIAAIRQREFACDDEMV